MCSGAKVKIRENEMNEPENPCDDCSCDQEEPMCENAGPPRKLGADEVWLKMRIDNGTPEGVEEEVDMACVMQTVWSIMMDLDQRVQALESGGEESNIIMPPDIEI